MLSDLEQACDMRRQQVPSTSVWLSFLGAVPLEVPQGLMSGPFMISLGDDDASFIKKYLNDPLLFLPIFKAHFL